MSTNPNYQVIPFPLPPYLASFFANQITTEPVLTRDGSKAKPFKVRRDSRFGSFLLRQLTKTNRPVIVSEGDTFFIEVSEIQTKKTKDIVDARYSFLNFKPEDIVEIQDVFKLLFESILIEYVSGFRDGITTIEPSKKRGVIHNGIMLFCKKYGVVFSNKNISSWKRMLNRHKNKAKSNTIRMLY
ncbi:hypothetical protein LNJ03_11320 [Tenacibaculum dicentrarchi]|nr:hypothetical protein [Tenacibaculum dicentrarchi]